MKGIISFQLSVLRSLCKMLAHAEWFLKYFTSIGFLPQHISHFHFSETNWKAVVDSKLYFGPAKVNTFFEFKCCLKEKENMLDAISKIILQFHYFSRLFYCNSVTWQWFCHVSILSCILICKTVGVLWLTHKHVVKGNHTAENGRYYDIIYSPAADLSFQHGSQNICQRRDLHPLLTSR